MMPAGKSGQVCPRPGDFPDAWSDRGNWATCDMSPSCSANDPSGLSGATSRRDYASYPPHRWPRTAGGPREVDRQTATIHCNASGAPPTSDRARGSGTGHVRTGWIYCARSSASTPLTRRCRRPPAEREKAGQNYCGIKRIDARGRVGADTSTQPRRPPANGLVAGLEIKAAGTP
jgi:hypothetical protein